MRDLRTLEIYRDTSPAVVDYYGNIGDETCGVFSVPSTIDGAQLKIIASSGEGWDHVSVSRRNRCPNWDEMEQVKRLFFREHEAAMQLHLPPADHISVHPHCLHIWRPHDAEIPLPPKCMVG